MRKLARAWLLLLPVSAGVAFGGGAVLRYTPGPAAIDVLAVVGFVTVFGFSMYRLYLRWVPHLLPSSDPITSMGGGDVKVFLKRLLLVVLVSVSGPIGGAAVFRYAPGPFALDLLAVVSFSMVYGLAVYRLLRHKRWDLKGEAV